jgi:hypothetical protein
MALNHYPAARTHLKLGRDAHVVNVYFPIPAKGGVENAIVLVYFPSADRQNWGVYYPGKDGHQVKFLSSLTFAQEFIEQQIATGYVTWGDAAA